MNSFVRFVVTVAALCTAPLALAAEGPTRHYLGVSYFGNNVDFETDDVAGSAVLENIMLKYGMTLIPHFGVELHGGMSLEREDELEGTKWTNVYLVGAFARGEFALPKLDVTCYGLLGVSRSKQTVTVPVISGGTIGTEDYSAFANGMSYGVGVELFGTPTTSLHVEWIKYLSTEDMSSYGFTAGLTHHFAMPKLW